MRPSGDYWVFLEVNEGAYGGRPHSDGPDSIDNLMANTRNNPLEDLAMHIPMICDRYELREDVCGAGQWRGGLGVETIFEIGSDDTQLVTFGDGDFEGAFGLAGGHGAGLNFIRLTTPDGREVVPRNKDLITGVPRGTLYHQVASGGGGWGDPRQRDRRLLAEEVRNGIVSREAAMRDYGMTEADLAVLGA